MAGTPADAFPKASFDGIPFPFSELRVRGGTRYAPHEFPHEPSEEIEKLGRRAYRITFKAAFHDVPGSDLAINYPNLYPVGIRQLMTKFEQELTAELVIPTIGPIKAMATDWDRTYRPTITTGESMDIEFIEDSDSALLVGEVIELGSPQAIIFANDNLQALAALAAFKRQESFSVFQQINDAVTQVQGIFGQADAYSRLVAGKIAAVADLCRYADEQLDDMQDPVNHVVLDAMKDLGVACIELADNIVQTRAELRTFVVPKLMSVQQIALNRYGSSERTSEILQLNAFEDAFAIPAGTNVRYVTTA